MGSDSMDWRKIETFKGGCLLGTVTLVVGVSLVVLDFSIPYGQHILQQSRSNRIRNGGHYVEKVFSAARCYRSWPIRTDNTTQQSIYINNNKVTVCIIIMV